MPRVALANHSRTATPGPGAPPAQTIRHILPPAIGTGGTDPTLRYDEISKASISEALVFAALGLALYIFIKSRQ